ncbi:MAG TPA: glycosyltransferase 87 family protein [Candidatus Polarisedimenticolia bacterium]|nr:glycosyltransferase 87 family protein [Candidatus Polarisedimenticolia bacterium]
MALGLFMEAGYLLLGHPRTSLGIRVAVMGILSAAYMLALREGCTGRPGRGTTKTILVFAILFRLSLLFIPPYFSDDLYRYLWDGRVQVEGGINPYRYAPADVALRPLADDALARVNHPEIPTVYPPFAQCFFAGVAALGGSAILLKTFLVLADLGLILLLLVMTRRGGLTEGRILIYAWCPLVVSEVAGNGHVDALAIFLLLVGIQLIIVARPGLSTLVLGLAAGVKLVPVLAFPPLARGVPRRFWAVPFVVVSVSYLPYLGAGKALVGGLREYAERWQHNDSLFRVLLGLLEAIRPTEPLKRLIAWLQTRLDAPALIDLLYRYAYPVYLARLLVALLLVALSFWIARRGVAPISGAFLVLSSGLLLSPTVHPWYVLWLVPFLVFIPSRGWILFTGLVSLSYLDPGPVGAAGHGMDWVRWAEYLPLFALLVVDGLRARQGRPSTLFDLPVWTGSLPPMAASLAGETETRAEN